jgi:hypothetical protein
MAGLSDLFLSSLNTWLQWIAIVGTGCGLFSSIALFFVGSEVGMRQERRLTEAHQESIMAREVAEKQLPRILTNEQLAIITQAMSPANPRPAGVSIWHRIDAESQDVARQVASAMHAAGYGVEINGQFSAELPRGIVLNSIYPHKAFRELMSDALRRAQIPFAEAPLTPSKDAEPPILCIGSKP